MKTILTFLTLIVLCGTVLAQPANDDCHNAQAISLSSGQACITGDNVNATFGHVFTKCKKDVFKEVWYYFIATGSVNTVTVKPAGISTADSLVLTLQSQGCDTLLIDECIAASGSEQISVSQGYSVGDTVWVNVGTPEGKEGGFELCISSKPAAGLGNTCEEAFEAGSKANFDVTIDSSINSSGFKPSCFKQTSNQDYWIKFDVCKTGLLEWTATPYKTTDPDGVELDWALYDVTAGCPPQNEMEEACNYHFSGPGNSDPVGMDSSSTTTCPIDKNTSLPYPEFCPAKTVVKGRTYAIVIDNFDNNSTGFSFEWGGDFEIACNSCEKIIAGSDKLCQGDTIILSAAVQGNGYEWSTGETSESIHVTAAGNYWLKVTDARCGDSVKTISDSVEVSFGLPAEIETHNQIINDTVTYCENDSAALLRANILDAEYLWSTGETTRTIYPAKSGWYDVVVFLSDKCSGSDSVYLQFNPKPTVTLKDTMVCGEDSVMLNLDAGNDGSFYHWSTGDSSQTTTIYSPGIYHVTVGGEGKCTVTESVQVNSFNFSLGHDRKVCDSIEYLYTQVKADSYEWSTGDTSSSIAVTQDGTYWLKATKGNCTIIDSVEVSFDCPCAKLQAEITSNPDSCTSKLGKITVNAIGGASPYTYKWSTGETSDMISGLVSGNYFVTITDNEGCIIKESVIVNDLCDSTDTKLPGNSCEKATQICSKKGIIISSTKGVFASGFKPTCFQQKANQDSWFKFTVSETGSLEWTATPLGDSTELDWALYDITDGCPVSSDSSEVLSKEVGCNYNFAGQHSDPTGMAKGSNTSCPTNKLTGMAASEFCPSVQVLKGKTYAIMIDNFDGNHDGFKLTWGGSFGMSGNCVTGIDNEMPLKDQGFVLYPNPAQNTLNVRVSGFKAEQILIRNMIGQVVYESLLTGDQAAVDLSNISKGVYAVSVLTDSGKVFTEKLIIQN